MRLRFFLLYSCIIFGAVAQTWADENSILFVSGSHSSAAKVNLLRQYAGSKGMTIEQKSEQDLGEPEEALGVFDQYDLIILDEVSKRRVESSFAKFQSVLGKTTAKSLSIKTPDDEKYRNGLTDQQAKSLFDYYENGGEKNFERMAEYLDYKIFGNDNVDVQSAIVYPSIGLYHPDYDDLIFPSLEDYRNWSATRNFSSISPKVVGIMLQRSGIESAQTTVFDETIRALEAKGVAVVPFYYELSPFASDYSALVIENGETVFDIIVNFRSIHWANKRKVEFEKFGVPVVQALTYFDGDQKEWEESVQGISIGMTPFTLILPETAGVIDPTIVAAVNQETDTVEIIDYQLEHLVDRVLAYAELKHKANSEKRMVVMFWGDRDMGASFLNVPESLQSISARLNDEGYSVTRVDDQFYIDRVSKILDPFYREYKISDLLDEDLAELYPVAKYREWLASLPQSVTAPIFEQWGEPEDNFMVITYEGQKQFVIPRIRNGNMLVMRQPPRGDSAETEQMLYHSMLVPINHYYLAAYFFAREVWNSDAIVHLGTHGSHEYLPGKERGLSARDPSNLTAGHLPILYPFIVDDVGEAMQTKRRGNAQVIAHMTPPFAAAGLQETTADLHELMHQYKALDEGGVKKKTAQQIADLCLAENICTDMGLTQEGIFKDFPTFLETLHDYLAELAAENQPLGLHSFGELPEDRLVTSTVVQMLGREFIEQAGAYEAKHEFGEHHHGEEGHHHHHGDGHEHGHSHDKEQDHHHDHDHENSSHREAHGEDIHEHSTELESLAGFKTVKHFIIGAADASELPVDLQGFIEKGRTHHKNMLGTKELDHLVDGLAGRYIPVKTGGDPVRHPESLASGWNLYGFDPAKLPTQAAYEQGSELVEDVIASYYQEHGEYPDKLAFSLWSIEAMRHYGVLESQALRAMGLKPVWSRDGRVIDTEIIPYSELKRPRVDVVLSATGLYRDAFPNVMLWMAEAIEKLAQLEEDNNSIWQNSVRIKNQLLEDGVSAEDAEYLSSVRIFSNVSGDYGSGVDGPVAQSDTWESDKKIADNYLRTMGNYFGSDESRWGHAFDGLYAKQLSGTDAVLFSRSSNVYGMITSDDPFEYFGSIAMAVRNIDGKSPEMLISNLRSANGGKMETAATFMAKELRTRNHNARWVEEMQKEGYSGAVTFASNMFNFWGWQVVDPNVVRDDQWQEFHEVYVQDKFELGLNEWFEEVNPGAQARLLETMLEATRKEYWKADEATLKEMTERLLELVNQYDLIIDNEKLREYVNAQAGGFGLDMSASAPMPQGAVDIVSAPEQVSGQQLEKVEQVDMQIEWNKTLIWTLFLCLLVFVAGFGRQFVNVNPVLSR